MEDSAAILFAWERVHNASKIPVLCPVPRSLKKSNRRIDVSSVMLKRCYYFQLCDTSCIEAVRRKWISLTWSFKLYVHTCMYEIRRSWVPIQCIVLELLEQRYDKMVESTRLFVMLLLLSTSSSLLAPSEMPVLLDRRKREQDSAQSRGWVFTQHIGHLDCIIHIVLGRRGIKERCAAFFCYIPPLFFVITE